MARHSRLAKAVAWPEQLRRVDGSGISISRFSARACGKGAEKVRKMRKRTGVILRARKRTGVILRKRTGVILVLILGKGQA